MYNPAPFEEARPEVLRQFIRENPLGVLVSASSKGLDASHLPMFLDADAGDQGVLRCHLARANTQWRMLDEASDVLIIFSGPRHYISPSWYESKKIDGKVVPTYNYIAVHVRARPRVFSDETELISHLQHLTESQEAKFAEPWHVDDAPSDYIKGLVRGILGVELRILAMEGKWKMSQNRPEDDQTGVLAGLRSLDTSDSLLTAAEMEKQRQK
jgi:transcriptional regulator